MFKCTPRLIGASILCVLTVCATPAFAAQIEPTTYNGLPAYRLSNGQTEAVVVPKIGRIMRYGKIGGDNLLWNAAERNWKPGDWKNYGGEKEWLAPKSSWLEFHGNDEWPPDPVLDGTPYDVREIAPGVLEMRSQVSPGAGVQITRTLSFAPSGDFVIKITARKLSGAPMRIGLWSIAQIVPGEAVFLPVSPTSVYKSGYLSLVKTSKVASSWSDMLRVAPDAHTECRIGVDSDVASIVSILHNVAFRIAADKVRGQYPDGAETAGCPVEFYVKNDPAQYYCELEMLGPLIHAKVGSCWSMTIHWSVHDISQHTSNLSEMARTLLKDFPQ